MVRTKKTKQKGPHFILVGKSGKILLIRKNSLKNPEKKITQKNSENTQKKEKYTRRRFPEAITFSNYGSNTHITEHTYLRP